MIDALYVRYSLRQKDSLDPRYKPEQAIVDRQFLNPGADKLAVIFPGWHNRSKQFPISRVIKRLQRKGWAVLVYDFHDQVLQANDETVVESFRFIRDTIADDLEKVQSGKNYSEIRLISISMGMVMLGLVADKYSHFTSTTVVVGGDNLAIDMWHGMRTKIYADEFRKIHIGIRKLTHDWNELAPVNHLRHFKDKPIKFVMGTRDEFVLTKYQEKLLSNLLDAGAKVKVKKHHGGHVFTIVLFALFDSPL